MVLEIEFEDDDPPDAVWPTDEAGPFTSGGSHTAETGATRPRTASARRAALLLQLGVLLTTFTAGATAVAGLQLGRAAAQNRTIAALHLAAGHTYTFSADPAAAGSEWSDIVDRHISLTVINDGPDPVTLVEGTLTGLFVQAPFSLPTAGLEVAAGKTATLHAQAQVDCGKLYQPLAATTIHSFDTMAHFTVRSPDGRTHRTTQTVDAASTDVISQVCGLLPPPVTIGAPQFSSLNRPASYTVTLPVRNAAPFALKVSALQGSVLQWSTIGGLTPQLTGTTIPAHGSGNVVVDVTVADCAAAVHATDDQFGDFALVFAESDNTSRSESFIQQAPLVSQGAIGQACNGR